MLFIRKQCLPRSKHYQHKLHETSLLVLYMRKIHLETQTQFEHKVEFLNFHPCGT
jgi:hypothetical protein